MLEVDSADARGLEALDCAADGLKPAPAVSQERRALQAHE